MDVLTLKDIAALTTPFFLFALGAGVGAIGYFLKALHKDINGKFAHAEGKIDRVEHDLMEFKAELPVRFVLKDDYIRTISSFEYKLDGLSAKMDRLMRERDKDGKP